MGLQRYRADEPGDVELNGSVRWYTVWIGGPSVALIRNCPTPFGARTVYVRGEPDTFFTLPAACHFKQRVVRGFLQHDIYGWVFIPDRDSWIYPRVMDEVE